MRHDLFFTRRNGPLGMVRHIRAAAPLALLAGTLGACSSTPTPTPHGEAATKAASLMQGTFTSREQAQQDPSFREVTLRMAPIWTDRTDAKWLYVEQALASMPERPYRQRVYRVSQDADGTVESMVLSLPGDPLQYAGAWREAAPLGQLLPDLLEPLGGCVVFLRQEGASKFSGGTQGTNCVSTREGAAYTTSEVTLDERGITSWDRGFDANGAQVWGSTAGPYRFVRISTRPDAPLPAAGAAP
ncbi:MAG: chromophore lyase CpcT/CpeT [Phycisphaeraceae bacterium]|nr:chromophore lyase CpcT/CpeT [Phycisphaeraceae bacterium]